MVVGESQTFQGGVDWLRERGVEVIEMGSDECVRMLSGFIAEQPAVWHEDIGEE